MLGERNEATNDSHRDRRSLTENSALDGHRHAAFELLAGAEKFGESLHAFRVIESPASRNLISQKGFPLLASCDTQFLQFAHEHVLPASCLRFSANLRNRLASGINIQFLKLKERKSVASGPPHGRHRLILSADGQVPNSAARLCR